MENKNKNKNGFLFTWGSCIVFLLVLCFFGISDSMKGTRSASGYCSGVSGVGSAAECKAEGGVWIDTSSSSKPSSSPSKPSSSPSGTGIDCRYDIWSGGYVGKDCVLDENGKPALPSSSSKPSSDENDDANYYGTLAEVLSKCKSMNKGVECDCKDLGALADGSHAFNCTPKRTGSDDELYTCDGGKTTQTSSICEKNGFFYPGGASSATCANLYGEGWEGSCKMNTGVYQLNGDGTKSYRFDCDCTKVATKVENDTEQKKPESDCSYDPWSGSYRDSKGKVCSLDTWESCPAGYYDTRPENTTSCDVKILSGGNACFNCVVDDTPPEEFCGEGTHLDTDESGKLVCLPDCECADGEDCSDKELCWNCSGNYFWGLETEYSNCSLTYRSKGNCVGSGPAPGPVPGPIPTPGPSSSNDRGNGCYKNKDTGAFKWFDSDPELNSSTKNYEKVNDSNCKQNVNDNPQTGEIAMFFIWIISFGAVGYSVWYYMKSRKES